VWEESPVGPPRKYYRLTDAGSAQLADVSAGWRSVARAVDDVLEGGVR
jgi:PadR family transcriptional regulator PadR